MARVLDRLVGHRATLTPLLEASANDRLASTLLFAGPSGIGKRLAAVALAQALACERNRGGACGECGSCLRIEKGGSESLLEVAPDGAQIKIEQARDIMQFISLQKLGRARVIIIDQAHALNPQAANALLKSLEEPPAGTHFILITSLAAAVLPTIRSRSQLVRFRPLSDEEVRQVVGPDADEWAVRSAQGSVEAARRMQDSREEFIELEDTAGQYLANGVARMPVDEISKLKELMKERSAQGFVAGVLQGVLRDALRSQAGVPASAGARFPEIVEAIQAWPSPMLRELAELSIEFEHDLARNVDRGLVLENFAIRWRQAASQAAAASR